jgi:hypothetical protein
VRSAEALLQLGVQPAHESLRTLSRIGHLGIERRRRLGSQHFFHCLALDHERCNLVTHLQNQIALGDQSVAIQDGTMPRNYFRVQTRADIPCGQGLKYSLQAATIGYVNDGVADAAEEVPDGHYVVPRKPYQRVAIRMGSGHRDQPYVW